MATRPTAAPIIRARPIGDPRRFESSRTARRPRSRVRRGAVMSAPLVVSPGGGAKLPAFRLEHVVEAPLGQLDAGREPEIPGLLHVLDDAAQRERAGGTPDDVRMHRERDVFRTLGAALRIKLVEIGLPGLEAVIRVAVFAMAMAEQRAVAERLARKLDQQLSGLFPPGRDLPVKAVGVEDKAVLDQKLDR